MHLTYTDARGIWFSEGNRTICICRAGLADLGAGKRLHAPSGSCAAVLCTEQIITKWKGVLGLVTNAVSFIVPLSVCRGRAQSVVSPTRDRCVGTHDGGD